MVYVPQTWVDGPDGETPISAARLTHLETGVVDAAADADAAAEAAVAATSAVAALAAGSAPVVVVTTGSEARPAGPFVIWVSPNGITPAHAAELDLVRVPAVPAGAVITTTGATFAPRVGLAAGSTSAVSWVDADGQTIATGVEPSITFGSAGTRTVRMVATVPTDVVTLNLGFDHTQDPGVDNLGATHDHPPQQISAVAGLGYLSGLRNFLAADTGLSGHLDLSGLAELEFVECFSAAVEQVTLTGCVSLIRLCLEQNALSAAVNLNPVAATLRDFRAAQQSTGVLTLSALSADLVDLWHWCLRDQTVIGMPAMARLPAVVQYWCWNTAQTLLDEPVSSELNSFLAYGNTYDQESVDNILVGLDVNGPAGGVVDLSGSAAPSATGAAAAASLASGGWTVTVEEDDPLLFADDFTTATGLWSGGAAASYGVNGGRFDLTSLGSGYQRALNSTPLPDDLVIEATRTAAVVDASNAQYFGIVARWDGTNGVRVFHDGSGAITVGNASGFATDNSVPAETYARPSTWSRLRAVLDGPSVQVWLDDTLVWEGTVSINTAGGSGHQVGFCGEPGDMDLAWTAITASVVP